MEVFSGILYHEENGIVRQKRITFDFIVKWDEIGGFGEIIGLLIVGGAEGGRNLIKLGLLYWATSCVKVVFLVQI